MKWERNSDHLAPKGLKDVHPLGRAPVIVDGEITVAESGAIVRKKNPLDALHCPSQMLMMALGPCLTEYLMRKYGKKRKTLSESAQMDDIYCARFSVTIHNLILEKPVGMFLTSELWPSGSHPLCRRQSYAGSHKQDRLQHDT